MKINLIFFHSSKPATYAAAVLQVKQLPIKTKGPFQEYTVLIGSDTDPVNRVQIDISEGSWRLVIVNPIRGLAIGDFHFTNGDKDKDFYIEVDTYELRTFKRGVEKRTLLLTPSRGASINLSAPLSPETVSSNLDFSNFWQRRIGPRLDLRQTREKALDGVPKMAFWDVPWFPRDKLQKIESRKKFTSGLRTWISALNASEAHSSNDNVVQLGTRRGTQIDRRGIAFSLPPTSVGSDGVWTRSFLSVVFGDQSYLMALPYETAIGTKARRISVELSFQRSQEQRNRFFGALVVLGDPVNTAIADYLTHGNLSSALSLTKSMHRSEEGDSIADTIKALTYVSALAPELVEWRIVERVVNALIERYPMQAETWICLAYLRLYSDFKDEKKQRAEILELINRAILCGFPAFTVAARMLQNLYEYFSVEDDQVSDSTQVAMQWLSARTQSNSMLTLVRIENDD